MNLGDFHELVSASLARGQALDSVIPSFTRMSVRWMERNFTFQYMKQFLLLEIDIDTALTPRVIELGPGAPKKIQFIRWVDDDSVYQMLEGVEPDSLYNLEGGTPDKYWLDGVERIILNKTPDESLSGEIRLDRFTAWPTELTFTHWLLDNAEDVLLAQTLLLMAARIRDPKLMQTYQLMRDEGLNTLLRSDDELQYGGKTPILNFLPAG